MANGETKQECEELFSRWDWECEDFSHFVDQTKDAIDGRLSGFYRSMDTLIESEVQKALTYAFTEFFEEIEFEVLPKEENDLLIGIETCSGQFDGLLTPGGYKSLKEQINQLSRSFEEGYIDQTIRALRGLADELEADQTANKSGTNGDREQR